MTENENEAAALTASDHIASARRLWWFVAIFMALGAVPGVLTLRDGISARHKVVMAVAYQVISQDESAAAVVGIRSPSKDAVIVAHDRSALVPDLKDIDMVVAGDDDARRILFTATDTSETTAMNAATEFATAFVVRARAELGDRRDRLVSYEKGLIADALKARDEANPSSNRSLDELALTLEIVDRTRRLSSYQQLQQPERVFADPQVFSNQPVSRSPAGIFLAIVGAAFGALFGIAIAAGVGVLDRRVRTRSDLERTVQGIDVLAVASDKTSNTAFLAAAGALKHRYGAGPSRIGVVGVGKGVDEAAAVARQLRSGLESLGQTDAGPQIQIEPMEGSLTDDMQVLVSTRGLDGVIVVASAGRTRDSDLADAVSSLRLIGIPIVGQVLVGVPSRELALARAPRQTP